LGIFPPIAWVVFMQPNSSGKPRKPFHHWKKIQKMVSLVCCLAGSGIISINMAVFTPVKSCVSGFVANPLIFNISSNICLANTEKFTNFRVEIQEL